MKTNELRIGNYILANIGAKKLDLRQITSEDLCDFANNKIELKPVELTDEILERAGFMNEKGIYRTNHYMFLSEYYISSKIKFGQKIFVLIMFGRFVKILKYFHQLQNVYFDLTEEELELKETKMSKPSNAEN